MPSDVLMNSFVKTLCVRCLVEMTLMNEKIGSYILLLPTLVRYMQINIL